MPYHSALTPGFSRKEIVSDENIGLGDVSEIDSLRDPGKFVNFSKTQFPYLRNDNHRICHLMKSPMLNICLTHQSASFLQVRPHLCGLLLCLQHLTLKCPTPETGVLTFTARSLAQMLTAHQAFTTRLYPNQTAFLHIALSEYPSLDHLVVPTCLHTSLGREVCK